MTLVDVNSTAGGQPDQGRISVLCVAYDSAHGLEPKRYSVAAVYDRRNDSLGQVGDLAYNGGHRPPLPAWPLVAKRKNQRYAVKSSTGINWNAGRLR